MTQYAYFDSTVAAPSPVIEWYDTAAFAYPTLPATADLLELTAEQWSAHMTGLWAVSGGALVAYTPSSPPTDTRVSAQIALTKSDITVGRCYEHGVTVPADWVAYRAALRAHVSGGPTTVALPVAPAYPAGT